MKKSKVPPKLKKLIRELIDQHSWNMGVSQYDVMVYYMEKDKQSKDGRYDLYAEIHTDCKYLKAYIDVFPKLIEEWQKEGTRVVEEVIAHEVAHILDHRFVDLATDRYADKNELLDEHERLTEAISRISIQLERLRNKKK